MSETIAATPSLSDGRPVVVVRARRRPSASSSRAAQPDANRKRARIVNREILFTGRRLIGRDGETETRRDGFVCYNTRPKNEPGWKNTTKTEQTNEQNIIMGIRYNIGHFLVPEGWGRGGEGGLRMSGSSLYEGGATRSPEKLAAAVPRSPPSAGVGEEGQAVCRTRRTRARVF
jgi:hypothetical protein